jgi:hypothetical protein
MSMIFPSETIQEYALHATLLESISADLDSDLMNHQDKDRENGKWLYKRSLVEKQEYENLFKSENKFLDWLNEAEEIYLCGLAFNIYDHELCNSFCRTKITKRKLWKRIVIVNTKNKKEEKKELLSVILQVDPSTIEYIEVEAAKGL